MDNGSAPTGSAAFFAMELYPNSNRGESAKEKETPSVDEKSFLVPRGAFGEDCKPGDIYKVKVLAVLDEELEVEPAGRDKDDKKEEKKDREKEPDDMANPVDRYMTNANDS